MLYDFHHTLLIGAIAGPRTFHIFNEGLANCGPAYEIVFQVVAGLFYGGAADTGRWSPLVLHAWKQIGAIVLPFFTRPVY